MLKSLLYFIPELFFDDKDEYKITSAKFNARKTVLALVMVVSLVSNFFFVNRLYVIAMKNVALKADVVRVTRENEALKAAEAVRMTFPPSEGPTSTLPGDVVSPGSGAESPRNYATRVGPQPRPPLTDFSAAKNGWAPPSDDRKVNGK